jgi:predicted nucleic acid-binding protein
VKVYLDSCIVIYLIEGSPPNRAAVEATLQTHRPTTTVISDLVRLECKVGPLRRDDRALLQRFDGFFASALMVPLGPAVYDLAAELRAQHHIKTPDALHAAAAIFHGCDEFWTNDRRLAALESRIALRVLPEVAPSDAST